MELNEISSSMLLSQLDTFFLSRSTVYLSIPKKTDIKSLASIISIDDLHTHPQHEDKFLSIMNANLCYGKGYLLKPCLWLFTEGLYLFMIFHNIV